MDTPKELKYTKEHEWVKIEDGKATIGITHFAQSELGDIVFVELPEAGDAMTKDQPFGSVESVKTVSELYAPLSGTVVSVNEELSDNPEFVNESPYEQAWMVVIELTNDAELEELMDADAYTQLIEQ
ncbi:MAG: glycine cleavage system protein GcvH [Solibacillus sp.]